MKKAKNSADAWEMQDMRKDEPHCWIQWKGTNVCMDFHCECGESSHIDDDFTYYIKCTKCKRVYFCNGHIELIELKEEPEQCVVEGQPWG